MEDEARQAARWRRSTSAPRLVIDGHLDLAMNALLWNRDLTTQVDDLRAHEREQGLLGAGRGRNTVTLPELRRGGVGLSMATLLARTGGAPTPGLPKYASAAIAYGMAQGQLAYYRILAASGDLTVIGDRAELRRHWERWACWRDAGAAPGSEPPHGIVVAMEGADSIPSPEHVVGWHADGLRIVGMTHYMDGTYAHGTGTEGGLKAPARELLAAMAACGMALDVTHLADQSFWEALELWEGPVLASHQNARALVPGQRQFDDEQLRAVIERGGVIGCALDAWMLVPGWERGRTTPDVVALDALVDHMARVCELAGNVDHVAVGSDLDGGFGNEQTPFDLDTIADLQKLPPLLAARGFSSADVDAVMHGNWLRFLHAALPS
jgi:membrane dipeptidase